MTSPFGAAAFLAIWCVLAAVLGPAIGRRLSRQSRRYPRSPR